VEQPGFRFLVSKLNPKYELPSRKHFIDHEIPLLYGEVKERVVATYVSWRELSILLLLQISVNRTPFMSFTVHFIDTDGVLQSYSLDTLPLYEDHTGENTMQDVLDNWNLDASKFLATTTDNGSNYIVAFNSFGWTRVSYFGHNLNLAVSKAADTYIVTKCNKLLPSAMLL